MKASRATLIPPPFVPITLTIETEEELRGLFAVGCARHSVAAASRAPAGYWNTMYSKPFVPPESTAISTALGALYHALGPYVTKTP